MKFPAFHNTAFHRIIREPLFHFTLAGVMVFLLAGALGSYSGAGGEIVIDDNLVERLSRLYETRMGSKPGEDELQILIEDYIHDEILYREALAMDLDAGDEIVRRRLIQKLDYLMGAGTDQQAPTEEQLQTWYDANAEQFALPGTVNFTHLYFNPDLDSFTEARERALATLKTLSAHQDASSAMPGDRFPLQSDYVQLSKQSAVQLFGNHDVVDALFTAPENTWSGPYASGYGWHLIYVQRRSPSSVPALGSIRNKVLAAYREYRERRNAETAFNEMQQRYNIIRDDQKK